MQRLISSPVTKMLVLQLKLLKFSSRGSAPHPAGASRPRPRQPPSEDPFLNVHTRQLPTGVAARRLMLLSSVGWALVPGVVYSLSLWHGEMTSSQVWARVSGHFTTGRPAATSARHWSCVAWKRVRLRGLGLWAGAAQPSPGMTASLPLAFAALSAAEYCDHAPHGHARSMAWRARMFRRDTFGASPRRWRPWALLSTHACASSGVAHRRLM